MESNHKILGMENNIAYGLCYLIPIISIVVLATDKELTRDNKLRMWESIIGVIAYVALYVIAAILFFVPVLPWIIDVFAYLVTIYIVVVAILNFVGKDTHVLVADKLAAKIVK